MPKRAVHQWTARPITSHLGAGGQGAAHECWAQVNGDGCEPYHERTENHALRRVQQQRYRRHLLFYMFTVMPKSGKVGLGILLCGGFRNSHRGKLGKWTDDYVTELRLFIIYLFLHNGRSPIDKIHSVIIETWGYRGDRVSKARKTDFGGI